MDRADISVAPNGECQHLNFEMTLFPFLFNVGIWGGDESSVHTAYLFFCVTRVERPTNKQAV